jgi:tricorn protease-like protein
MFIEKIISAAELIALVFYSISATLGWSQQQQISNLDRSRAQDMLRRLASEVRKHYYDPKFHGVDWDAKVAEARQKIEKATSMNMALSRIAAALDALNDTHTFFLPPEHAFRPSTGCSTRWWGALLGEPRSTQEQRRGQGTEAQRRNPNHQRLPRKPGRPLEGAIRILNFASATGAATRGLVIGDHSSGSVMESGEYSEQTGTDTSVYYGSSITEWNLIMADRQSLEEHGSYSE